MPCPLTEARVGLSWRKANPGQNVGVKPEAVVTNDKCASTPSTWLKHCTELTLKRWPFDCLLRSGARRTPPGGYTQGVAVGGTSSGHPGMSLLPEFALFL